MSPTPTAVFLSALLLAWNPAARPAEAQEAAASPATAEAEPQDAARAEAERHFRSGNALMEAENWQGALLEFERSLELFPTRAALFNFGMCQKALYRYVDAMATFQRYLDEYRDQADPEQLRRVAEVIEELRPLLAEIAVVVDVPGAEILLDGEPAGTAPLRDPIRVVAGRYRIGARAEGHEPSEQAVSIVSGETLTVTLSLPAIVTTGTVVIDSPTPGARLTLDGTTIDAGFPYRAELGGGGHAVVVEADGFIAYRGEIVVTAGRTRELSFALDPVPAGAVEEEGHWYSSWWFWTIVGVAAAGAVTGGVLGTMDVAEVPAGQWNVNLQ